MGESASSLEFMSSSVTSDTLVAATPQPEIVTRENVGRTEYDDLRTKHDARLAVELRPLLRVWRLLLPLRISLHKR